jgi:hypothetical protein
LGQPLIVRSTTREEIPRKFPREPHVFPIIVTSLDSTDYKHGVQWPYDWGRRTLYNYHPCWSVTRRFDSQRKVRSPEGLPEDDLAFRGETNRRVTNYKGQTKYNKRTNNDLRSFKQKTKGWAKWTPLKIVQSNASHLNILTNRTTTRFVYTRFYMVGKSLICQLKIYIRHSQHLILIRLVHVTLNIEVFSIIRHQ